MKEKILFITSSFPSNEFPHHGTFNFKAVKEISKKQPVQVVHLRSNNLKRPFYLKREFNGIDVIEISIFYYSSLSNRFTAFNIGIYKRIANQLLGKKLEKKIIIHSVGLTLSGQVGAYISKRNNLKHIAQAIGSDINFILPELKNYYGVKYWEKNTNLISCNSMALEKEVKKHYPKIATKVIYRGVDLKQYAFKEMPDTKKFGYLYLGGLSIIKSKLIFNRKHPIKVLDKLGEDTKGGVLLLKAWKTWKNSTNNTDAILYYGGPNTSVKKINRIIDGDYKKLNLVFLGALKKSEVIEKIKTSHVVIVPSYAEGLPNVAMEAFSIGRPVIGANVGGIPELVKHHKTGFLFEKGNKNELIEALNYYYKKKDKISLIGEKARMKVEKDFDSKNFIKNYNKLYINEK